jgi:hypothetical protein
MQERRSSTSVLSEVSVRKDVAPRAADCVGKLTAAATTTPANEIKHPSASDSQIRNMAVKNGN